MSTLRVERDFELQPCNSFGVRARARHYVELRDEADLSAALQACGGIPPDVILGGGSNLLLTGDIKGTVLRVATQGWRILEENPDVAVIEAAAGENWHTLVMQTLEAGWFGLENLALIPGTVGAAPIQNIGAYGLELQSRFDGLTAVDLRNGEQREFTANDCRLQYRDSVFKRPDHSSWLILRVRLRLLRRPELRLGYAELRDELATCGVNEPTARDVADAVIRIRRRKLPDPTAIGNAGSFFKNPLVTRQQCQQLRQSYPSLPVYESGSSGQLKLSAAWLIEQCGWKGRREADAGVYAGHALILVNHGSASGAQILELARHIQDSVRQRFAVDLEIEPRVV